jgi:basic amino acid/polyamine antiporter, APA family
MTAQAPLIRREKPLSREYQPHLRREISLLGLVATAVAAMVGVGVNILPFMVQRSQPGIGRWVPLAYLVAAVPAVLAALCYAALVSAMPRAGGSYVNVSRALNPFAGFIASFSQWFGLCMAMGVVAYFLVPVIRDLLAVAGVMKAAAALDLIVPRLWVSLLAIWLAWLVNLLGVRFYERSVLLMALMTMVAPIIMTAAGVLNSPQAALVKLQTTGTVPLPPVAMPRMTLATFLGTAVVLFSSFIGFDAVAQAAGEARHPTDLARAIMIAIGGVAAYYVCFTWSVYHAIPAEYIYRVSLVHDISAPGLMAPLLPRWLSLTILASVAVAIIKVLPAVTMANSRTLYAFGADGLLPRAFSRIHERFRTPPYALTVTAIVASLCVLGCNLAGDFFLGVDLLVVSMLVNFLLMAGALLTFPLVNPELHKQITFLESRKAQVSIAIAAILLLGALLIVQIASDVSSTAPWYLKSTTSWVVVMSAACILFWRFWTRLTGKELDQRAQIFRDLPPE